MVLEDNMSDSIQIIDCNTRILLDKGIVFSCLSFGTPSVPRQRREKLTQRLECISLQKRQFLASHSSKKRTIDVSDVTVVQSRNEQTRGRIKYQAIRAKNGQCREKFRDELSAVTGQKQRYLGLESEKAHAQHLIITLQQRKCPLCGVTLVSSLP